MRYLHQELQSKLWGRSLSAWQHGLPLRQSLPELDEERGGLRDEGRCGS